MKEPKELSDDELRMEEFCTIYASIRAKREQARVSEISAHIGAENMGTLMADITTAIKELERKGIKRVVVEEKPKNDQAGPQDPKIRA